MTKIYVVPKDDSKKEKARAWLKNRKTDAEAWWEENKETVMVLGPAAIGLATLGFKVFGKRINLRKEQQLKELFMYDNSTRRYWPLKRKLTIEERLTIERLQENGERLGNILAQMGMLKGL
jgi:hypothetical protein